MARVPTLDNFSNAPQGGGFGRVSAPEVQDVAGRQLQQLGGEIQQAGGLAARIETDVQQEANRLRVTDALNRAKERATRLTFDKDEGFQAKRGIDALERPNGKTLTDEYSETLGGTLDEIQQGLGNDVQRQAFREAARGLMGGFRADLTKHEASEFNTYATSVDEGATSNAINDMGLYWNDPARVDDATLTIRASTDRLRRRLGKSAEWGEARTRELLSKGHLTAIGAAIDKDDLSYAEGYLDRFKGQMEADDILRVDGLIGKRQDALVATQAADELFAGFASVGETPGGPTDFQRMVQITAQAESGNKDRDAKGQLVTSRAGAQGRMQVMPGTNFNPGFGVKPAADASDGERARVGRDYLQTMLKRYGNPAKAWAAYNAGPGALEAAVKKHGNDWLAHMPRETQAYVASNTQALNGGGGRYSGRSLLDMLQSLATDPRLAGHPERLAQAEQRVRSLYNAQEEQERETKEAVQTTVFERLYQNGGNLATLTAAERQALGPGGMSSALSFANQVQAERQQKLEPDDGLWAELKLDPDRLRRMTPSELLRLRPTLGKSNFADLVGDREKFDKGETKPLDTARTVGQGFSFLRAELAEAGLDTSPKPGSKDAKQLATFKAAYVRAVQAEEGVTGKPLSSDRARQIGLGLLNETVVKDGWFWDTKKRNYEQGAPGNAALYDAMSASVRSQIMQSLQRRLPRGTRITKGMVAQEYATYLQER